MTTNQATPTVIDSFTGRYAFLSNFYASPINYEGIVYPTVEHAFQAAKTFDTAQRRSIAAAPTPAKAKRLGRTVSLRSDWEDVKVDIMLTLLRIKFENPRLAQRLGATRPAELIEGNHWHDRFWGVCSGCWKNCDHDGQNYLGRLLDRVRADLTLL